MSTQSIPFEEDAKQPDEGFEYQGCVKIDFSLLENCLKRKKGLGRNRLYSFYEEIMKFLYINFILLLNIKGGDDKTEDFILIGLVVF